MGPGVFIMDLSVRCLSVHRVRPGALIACRAGRSSRLRRQGRALVPAGAGTIVHCRWNERLHGFSLQACCG